MSKLKLPWINGMRLMERWNLYLQQFSNVIFDFGLPIYNPDYAIEDQGVIYRKSPNPNHPAEDREKNVLAVRASKLAQAREARKQRRRAAKTIIKEQAGQNVSATG
jgi:hypothetical protein